MKTSLCTTDGVSSVDLQLKTSYKKQEYGRLFINVHMKPSLMKVNTESFKST